MVRNKFSVNYFIQMKKLLVPIVVVVVKQEIDIPVAVFGWVLLLNSVVFFIRDGA